MAIGDSIAESISRFTNSVGDTISVTFKNISDFVDTVITFFVSLGFWTSVIWFFAIFLILISAPLIIFRYWNNIINQYKKLLNRFFSIAKEKKKVTKSFRLVTIKTEK